MTDYRDLPLDEKMEVDVDLSFLPIQTRNDILDGQKCVHCINDSCCCTCSN